MRFFTGRPFQHEFVVDEKPLAVIDDAEGDVEVDGTAARANGTDDLLSLVITLLKEHETLSHLTDELKAREGDSDEIESFMAKLLPFLDSFDRVLFLARNHPAPDDMANWLKSVEGLYYRLTETLEAFGLVAMRTVGHTVDLDLHEVVEMHYAPDRPVDTVISERKRGYLFRGRLLRCAAVVVSQR